MVACVTRPQFSAPWVALSLAVPWCAGQLLAAAVGTPNDKTTLADKGGITIIQHTYMHTSSSADILDHGHETSNVLCLHLTSTCQEFAPWRARAGPVRSGESFVTSLRRAATNVRRADESVIMGRCVFGGQTVLHLEDDWLARRSLCPALWLYARTAILIYSISSTSFFRVSICLTLCLESIWPG
jgi:hypothetical protein